MRRDPLPGQVSFPGLEDKFREKAEAWVKKNPVAWWRIKMRAHEYAMQGRKFGIGALAEEVRWGMRADGVDDFKLNNNIRASLADMIVEQFPECANYVERRKRRHQL